MTAINFSLNDRSVYTIKETETHLVEVIPMLFNDRVVLTPKTCLWVYDYGWCYDKGGAAFYAAYLWNPDTEAEPAGYKKAPLGERKLPERATGADQHPHTG